MSDDWDGFYLDHDDPDDDHPDDNGAYCGRCGHVHLDRTLACSDPHEPCGDYRCCIN